MDALRRSCMRGLALALPGLAATGRTSAQAQSEDYPSRPVRLVVPYSPGGQTDIVGRIVASRLGDKWGRSVLVENRPGAGGTIGTALAAKAAPDGYTLLIGATSNIAVSTSLYEKVPFDPIKDFAPITLIATSPQLLVVRADFQASTVQELVRVAKTRPGKLNYSSYGNGSLAHLTGELFRLSAEIDVVHVPYKGGADAVTAVVADDVQMTFATIPVALPAVKAGKVKLLAITSERRFSALEDVPTFSEAGLPALTAESWAALLAPAGTPRAVIQKVREDVGTIVSAPDVAKTLAAQGLVPQGSTPEALAELIRSEVSRWGKVVKSSGIRVDN